MAGIAAGAVAAEQVISTAIYGGLAGHAIVKGTLPLKASLRSVDLSSAGGSAAVLKRSNHGMVVIGDRAYVFGGKLDNSSPATSHVSEANSEPTLACNGVYSFPYRNANVTSTDDIFTPAIGATADERVPEARRDAAICTLDGKLVVLGGVSQSDEFIGDNLTWTYDPDKSVWSTLDVAPGRPVPSPRKNAQLFPSQTGGLVLCGGFDQSDQPLADVWHYDSTTKSWSRLPEAPVSTQYAAMSLHTLYILSKDTDTDGTTTTMVHYLDTLAAALPSTWQKVAVPGAPLWDEGGRVVRITTGYGREYLFCFAFPEARQGDGTVHQQAGLEMWALQLPSSDIELQKATSISESIKPAKIKDAIREKLGMETGVYSWAPVDVKEKADGGDSVATPGVRAGFACSVSPDGRGVVIQGGQKDGCMRDDVWGIELE